MKKFIFFLVAVSLCMAFTIAFASNHTGIRQPDVFVKTPDLTDVQTITLPLSLQVIGEEA